MENIANLDLAIESLKNSKNISDIKKVIDMLKNIINNNKSCNIDSDIDDTSLNIDDAEDVVEFEDLMKVME